jgi:hypothetical protein
MLISAVFSAVFFDLHVNAAFVGGFLSSILSFWIYYGGPQVATAHPDAADATEQASLLRPTDQGGSEAADDPSLDAQEP